MLQFPSQPRTTGLDDPATRSAKKSLQSKTQGRAILHVSQTDSQSYGGMECQLTKRWLTLNQSRSTPYTVCRVCRVCSIHTLQVKTRFTNYHCINIYVLSRYTHKRMHNMFEINVYLGSGPHEQYNRSIRSCDV